MVAQKATWVKTSEKITIYNSISYFITQRVLVNSIRKVKGNILIFEKNNIVSFPKSSKVSFNKWHGTIC